MADLPSHQQADLEKNAAKDVQFMSENHSQDELHYTHPLMMRLMSWGLEARGMSRVFNVGVSIDLCLCRDPSCSARGASGHTIQQDILHLALMQLQYTLVRSLLLLCCMSCFD